MACSKRLAQHRKLRGSGSTAGNTVARASSTAHLVAHCKYAFVTLCCCSTRWPRRRRRRTHNQPGTRLCKITSCGLRSTTTSLPHSFSAWYVSTWHVRASSRLLVPKGPLRLAPCRRASQPCAALWPRRWGRRSARRASLPPARHTRHYARSLSLRSSLRASDAQTVRTA